MVPVFSYTVHCIYSIGWQNLLAMKRFTKTLLWTYSTHDWSPIGLSELLLTGSEHQDFQASHASLHHSSSIPNHIPPPLLLCVLMLPNRPDCLRCTLTLGRNSCSEPVHVHSFVAHSVCGCFPPHYLYHSVMQSNTRVTLGPSERHPGGAAKFLIWPQNMLAYSCFL